MVDIIEPMGTAMSNRTHGFGLKCEGQYAMKDRQEPRRKRLCRGREYCTSGADCRDAAGHVHPDRASPASGARTLCLRAVYFCIAGNRNCSLWPHGSKHAPRPAKRTVVRADSTGSLWTEKFVDPALPEIRPVVIIAQVAAVIVFFQAISESARQVWTRLGRRE